MTAIEQPSQLIPASQKTCALGERALLGPAESPDPPREVLAENGAGVQHLLELENPGLLLSRQRLSSFDRPGLCIVHIASSGKGKPLGSVPERLTKSFRCADAGVVCRKKVTGETEDEFSRRRSSTRGRSTVSISRRP